MIFSSCENISFSPDEMNFFAPFQKANTIIYQSDKGGLNDTICFSKSEIKEYKIRHIELGFYNQNDLFTSYMLSKGSYHKITNQSIDGRPYYFIFFSKSTDSNSSKIISFLGLSFDDKYIDLVLKRKNQIVVFDKKDARYNGININKGIKSFKYNLEKGVISFIDEDDIMWNRIN